MRPSLLAVLLALAAAALPAQSPYAIGTRDVSLPNTTGQGSANLTASVYYPATTAGSNAQLLARTGGWPVIVFLHGFLALGNFYPGIGNALAADGYVVVLSNTMQFDNQGQEYDGRALYTALQTANGNASSPFAGGLDLSRAALLGHSMGGGNVGNVLANNPGYHCGIGLAPVTPRGNNAALVSVPMLIVVGTGDTIAPAATYGQPFYNSLTGYRGCKALYLLNGDCTHTNVCGLTTTGTSGLVFQRAMTTTLGFCRRYLRDEAGGLEDVIGVGARAEPRLTSLSVAIEEPEVWAAGALHVGNTTRLSIAAEPGFAGALAAFGTGSLSTPFGLLRLDASTAFVLCTGFASAERRFDSSLAVPNDPGLVGLGFVVQGFGATVSSALRLGSSASVAVVL